MEGVLVTGTARAGLDGECARCLDPIADELEVTFQELFLYDDQRHDSGRPPRGRARTTRSARSRTTCSTSNPCCGTRWCSHYRSSRCARTTVPGLCTECGASLKEDPDHTHDAPIDPRWAALADIDTD